MLIMTSLGQNHWAMCLYWWSISSEKSPISGLMAVCNTPGARWFSKLFYCWGYVVWTVWFRLLTSKAWNQFNARVIPCWKRSGCRKMTGGWSFWIVNSTIKDTVNKGQPLYNGCHCCPQIKLSYSSTNGWRGCNLGTKSICYWVVQNVLTACNIPIREVTSLTVIGP